MPRSSNDKVGGKTPKQPSNEITDFYGMADVKKHIKKTENPAFKDHHIPIPFRALIIGSSGAGKTTVALELIKRMPNTFDFIVLICRSVEEPLYQYLIKKCRGMIHTVEIDSKTAVPTLDEIIQFKQESKDNILVIYDDLVALNPKKQEPIEDAFIRARKFNVSLMYLTQSYFKTSKIIRLNSNIVIIKKVSNLRDIRMVLSDYNLDKTVDEMVQGYKKATENVKTFMLIRLDLPSDDPHKITLNFHESLFP
jgi:Cdc6-like AAA superfamily ATPase